VFLEARSRPGASSWRMRLAFLHRHVRRAPPGTRSYARAGRPRRFPFPPACSPVGLPRCGRNVDTKPPRCRPRDCPDFCAPTRCGGTEMGLSRSGDTEFRTGPRPTRPHSPPLPGGGAAVRRTNGQPYGQHTASRAVLTRTRLPGLALVKGQDSGAVPLPGLLNPDYSPRQH
jgi:hypothetical protein